MEWLADKLRDREACSSLRDTVEEVRFEAEGDVYSAARQTRTHYASDSAIDHARRWMRSTVAAYNLAGSAFNEFCGGRLPLLDPP